MTGRLTAVTGASGFLGRHIVQALIQRGDQVRILLRNPAACPPWEGAEPEIVQGELTPAPLRKLVAGAHTVIHCAGLISAKNWAEFDLINHRGAQKAAAATLNAAPDARFVFISTLAARGPSVSAYGDSKNAGEGKVRTVLAAKRPLIVRPPAIYGPGDRATLPLFRMAAKSPILPLLRPDYGRLALIHVEDAAAAILGLAKDGVTGTVALGGDRPEGYAWRELVLALADVFDRRPPLVRVPPAIIKAAAVASVIGARLGGRPAIFTPGKARELLHPDWSVSAAELGAHPQPVRYTLAEGLSKTAAWYREHGWL
jgi:nucleoside-diphosphate-sugar epimerase